MRETQARAQKRRLATCGSRQREARANKDLIKDKDFIKDCMCMDSRDLVSRDPDSAAAIVSKEASAVFVGPSTAAFSLLSLIASLLA